MADIPVAELIQDVRQYLRCLAPHVKQRKAALLLSRLVTEAERLQAENRIMRYGLRKIGACAAGEAREALSMEATEEDDKADQGPMSP